MAIPPSENFACAEPRPRPDFTFVGVSYANVKSGPGLPRRLRKILDGGMEKIVHFWGVPPFLSIFAFVTEKLAISYVPARTSQDQLAGSWSQYLTSPQPTIMSIIDRWRCVLSIIIIIIGGRGCGLVRYSGHDLARWQCLSCGAKILGKPSKLAKTLPKGVIPSKTAIFRRFF